MKPRKRPKKPALPRGRMPPPGRVHRDGKKDGSRTACRRFRKDRSEQ